MMTGREARASRRLGAGPFFALEAGAAALIGGGRRQLLRWGVVRGVELVFWLSWAPSSGGEASWGFALAALVGFTALEPGLLLEGVASRQRLLFGAGGLARWAAVLIVALGPGLVFVALGGSPELRVGWALVLLPLNVLTAVGSVAIAGLLIPLPARWAGLGSAPSPKGPRVLAQVVLSSAELLAAVGATAVTGVLSRSEVLAQPVDALFTAELQAIAAWRLLGAPVAAWASAVEMVFRSGPPSPD